MSGCFEVAYRFVEDSIHDMFSPDWMLDKPVVEWIGFEHADADGEVILPHVAIVPRGVPIAHWYEVWSERSSEEG